MSRHERVRVQIQGCGLMSHVHIFAKASNFRCFSFSLTVYLLLVKAYHDNANLPAMAQVEETDVRSLE